VLATTENLNFKGIAVLDENAFADGKQYAIVYCFENQKNQYLSRTNQSGKLLYSGNNFLIMQILSHDFMPAKNDGMVAIMDIQARLPAIFHEYPVITEPDEDVLNYLSQISIDTVMSYIQTLQDFETRNCWHTNIDSACKWIKEKYTSYGLDVSLHHFTQEYNGNLLDNNNVIAIQYGTVFPDEYVVCGAHYDSYTSESKDNAPGSDDNASGTAGILETARILSQYDFQRSIIYCAFSGEEYGLFGSGAFAKKCAAEKMNIVGYFNLDMTGYLTPGNEIHISLIYPNSANSLANYYTNVCDVYFPEVPITNYAALPGGNSDHSSFNTIGYRGLFPFEDIIERSPYIHHIQGAIDPVSQFEYLGDIIGPSVNNPEQVNLFTKANLANVAILAMYNQEMPPPPLYPPTNCVAKQFINHSFKITWDAPELGTPSKYFVYKDSVFCKEVTTTEYSGNLSLSDHSDHCYYVSAVYVVFESEFSNQSCTTFPNAITEENSNFNIFPNPTTGELRIMNNEQLIINNVEVYDVMGRRIEIPRFARNDVGDKFPSNELEGWQPQADGVVLNISHLSAGIYFLKIETEKDTIVQKIIKN
jgi:hypothetical protein